MYLARDKCITTCVLQYMTSFVYLCPICFDVEMYAAAVGCSRTTLLLCIACKDIVKSICEEENEIYALYNNFLRNLLKGLLLPLLLPDFRCPDDPCVKDETRRLRFPAAASLICATAFASTLLVTPEGILVFSTPQPKLRNLSQENICNCILPPPHCYSAKVCSLIFLWAGLIGRLHHSNNNWNKQRVKSLGIHITDESQTMYTQKPKP